MAASASVMSMFFLALASVFVVLVVCVSTIPETSAAVFYVMAINHIMNLALSAMLVALTESGVYSLVAMYALRVTNKGNVETAAHAYFTAAKKELEDDAPGHRRLQEAQLEVCDAISKLLKALSSVHSRVDSQTSTTPPSEPSSCGQAVPLMKMAEELGGDASHAAPSSSCTAADTASVKGMCE